MTQTDPPYGPPGAIGKWSFRDEGSSGSTSGGGDGGSSGTSGAFPAPYNEANPPAPTQATETLHPTVANNIAITKTTPCLSCHGAGASGSTKKWAFAGWAGSTATTGLDKGEVIVVDGANVLGPVKTAPDGYFWLELEGGTIGPNAKTVIRDKTGKTSAMQQVLAGNGDCSSAPLCHGANAGPVDFKP